MRRGLAAVAVLLVLAGSVTAAVAVSASTSADPAASCLPPSYDGSTLQLSCTVPQATATVTATETQTTTETATVTQTATQTVTATATVTQTVTATPPPTPTPTPTQPPTAAAFPDATNTGTPAGVTLHTCPNTITAAGTYDACQFGNLSVRAAGVVITRSRIDGNVSGVNDDLRGVVIRDTTVDCHCPSTSNTSTPTAVMGSNFTLTRVNLSNSGHGVAPSNNVVIEDSWIHGLGGNTDAHKDGLYVGDGSNVTVRHNSIECNDGLRAGCTAAIGLLSDFATISYWTIDGNLLNTNGSYCFYGGGGPSKPYRPNHITFVNNHFGRKDNQQCGFYGPVTYFDVNAAGNVWSGNVWDDTGASVPPVN